jgi:hypothetical protein
MRLQARTRERHVEHAHLLGEPLACSDGAVLLDFRGAKIERDFTTIGLMIAHVPRIAQIGLPPAERAEDHVVFEALALVNGDDVHRLLIAFEAELVLFIRAETPVS